MKSPRKLILLITILLMALVFGFIVIDKGTFQINGLIIFIIALTAILSAYLLIQAFKKDKEKKEGFALEDELSDQIKFKSGYYAYISSMYMWLILFLFKEHFPDIETLLGGGILLSAFIGFICKIIIKRQQ